ncbi:MULTISPECIES: ribonuclease catalytic domain-containing protein [Nitrosomonas]|uniref:Exoribonuclease-2 n=1 Tax=Nitrosomonas communis TaxID=44574 RepID=A0A0F7KAV4_9PROT|nr:MULTISPECIES: ribonuclease catalytic domain-containing protein [Nitrosomonas]AKH37485.1 ribonuclease II [Nitrosomonas communis]TYP92317.1 exoribonuclease-2 [Nitrosomonas communis]UVS62732.1 RNB domain-containing ribonuclease [Nitrosomonas sp. PLL12]
MNVFYEESGTFKVGAVLADNTTSLQVEASHGKRSKIKASAVLLRFEMPSLYEFMYQAQQVAADLDTDFLWECCTNSEEFSSHTLAADYFGHSPSPVEVAAIMILLNNSPMYFYKKGQGRYKAAPAEALRAALASQEKKRLEAEQQTRYKQQLSTFTLPEEFRPQLDDLLYKPNKNTIEWKALEAACTATKLSVPKLLEKCGAISSTHDYHFNQFLREHFPEGIDFNLPEVDNIFRDYENLPIAEVAAFSIDDATTTEIDDAFSVTPLALGSFRIGIHIAAPALGITPGSHLDKVAAKRLSTVYLPGQKITMLPEKTIDFYTLSETRLCPAISLYLDVADDFTVTASQSRIEKIRIVANLRHDTLEQQFNEDTLRKNLTNYPFANELSLLWNFSRKMEIFRGKENDLNNEKIDYSFFVEQDRIIIQERRRGSPIDRVVSELMIYANTEWGKQLADAGIAGIYRSQNGGKVKMSLSPAPHQGLGVAQYAWSSSPMRRYIDLINQRQLIALLKDAIPPYSKESDELLISMRDFEQAYSIYSDFQRAMERYWCLRWLLQENIQVTGAQVIKENLVKLDRIPFIVRVSSLPDLLPGTIVKLELSQIDLIECTLNTRFLSKE